LCEFYSCTTTHGIPQLLYNVTAHYSVHHSLSLVHYVPCNIISYVWPKGITTCTFAIRFPNQNIVFISHVTCMLHATKPTLRCHSICSFLLTQTY
jgi:hypothetical protein